MFLQGQSKIIREGDRGTLASALIFSAKPLTDNNAEVKSLESGGGRLPHFWARAGGDGAVPQTPPLVSPLNHGLHGQVPRLFLPY